MIETESKDTDTDRSRHGQGQGARDLQARLRAREAPVRKEAAREAGERRIAAAAPRLMPLLHDRNTGVATTATWALGRLGYAVATAEVAALLYASNTARRQAAARALGQFATADALAALLAALPDADDALAPAILAALDDLPRASVVPRLIALLRDPRGPLRARASRALLRYPTEALPAVVAALAQSSAEAQAADDATPFRRAAAHIVAEAAPSSDTPDAAAAALALPALLDLSHAADPRTRLYATRGLGRLAMGAPRAWERLERLRDDERRDVAAAALQALGDGEALDETRARIDTEDVADAASAETAPDDDDAPAGTGALPLELAAGQTYLLTVLDGLEDIAAAEVVEIKGARVTRRLSGVLLVGLDAPSAVLNGLRTVLDATLFASYLPPAPGATGATGATDGAMTTPRFRDIRPVRQAFAAITAARPDLPLTVYVHVPRRMSQARARALRDAAAADLARVGARLEATRASLTADVVLASERPLLGIRVLSDAPGHRPLPEGGLPASLNATLAAAMVRLTAPTPDDIFLDPLCGAGTLLRERALAGPYAGLIGGDRERRAITLARANLAGLSDLTLQRWDATALPLPDASVDKAALNPPYGRRAGSHEGNTQLYPAVMGELARVVRPGGLVAWITTERRLTTALLREQNSFAREDEIPVETGGLRATVYLLRRR